MDAQGLKEGEPRQNMSNDQHQESQCAQEIGAIAHHARLQAYEAEMRANYALTLAERAVDESKAVKEIAESLTKTARMAARMSMQQLITTPKYQQLFSEMNRITGESAQAQTQRRASFTGFPTSTNTTATPYGYVNNGYANYRRPYAYTNGKDGLCRLWVRSECPGIPRSTVADRPSVKLDSEFTTIRPMTAPAQNQGASLKQEERRLKNEEVNEMHLDLDDECNEEFVESLDKISPLVDSQSGIKSGSSSANFRSSHYSSASTSSQEESLGSAQSSRSVDSSDSQTKYDDAFPDNIDSPGSKAELIRSLDSAETLPIVYEDSYQGPREKRSMPWSEKKSMRKLQRKLKDLEVDDSSSDESLNRAHRSAGVIGQTDRSDVSPHSMDDGSTNNN